MSDRLQGKIIKGIGGFYYVDTGNGVPVETRARGIFRKEGIVPLIGDEAEISVDAEGRGGFVEKIFPRRNMLTRPPVANVDYLAIVIATANPKPNLYVMDKMIAAAEYAGIHPILCLNKIDLDTGEELQRIYEKTGYDVLCISAKERENTDKLSEILQGHTTAFAGNSGVGKSSILNCLLEKEWFDTGEVNDRIERGRHTTRHSELVPLPGGGYVIDTPGFSTFQLTDISAPEVAELFIEFRPYLHGCKFNDCLHMVEKGCAVLEGVANGTIAVSRHENYKRLLEEVKAEAKW